MTDHTPRLVITTGEPAGIGPDVVLMAAIAEWPGHIVAVGDIALLEARARALALDITLTPYSSTETAEPHQPGRLSVIDLPLTADCQAGQPDHFSFNLLITFFTA